MHACINTCMNTQTNRQTDSQTHRHAQADRNTLTEDARYIYGELHVPCMSTCVQHAGAASLETILEARAEAFGFIRPPIPPTEKGLSNVQVQRTHLAVRFAKGVGSGGKQEQGQGYAHVELEFELNRWRKVAAKQHTPDAGPSLDIRRHAEIRTGQCCHALCRRRLGP